MTLSYDIDITSSFDKLESGAGLSSGSGACALLVVLQDIVDIMWSMRMLKPISPFRVMLDNTSV